MSKNNFEFKLEALLHKDNINLCIDMFSKFYPIPENLLIEYAYVWKWGWLSSNRAIEWNEKLIELFSYKWDWTFLSQNESIEWNKNLIEKFKNEINWYALSNNKCINWSEDLIHTFKNNWTWPYLMKQPQIASNQNLFNLCLTYWEEWEIEIIFKSNYTKEASHPNLNKKVIKKYLDKWPEYDWKTISERTAHASYWDFSFIEELKDKWNWEKLSCNTYLLWSKELIEKFQNKWNWNALSLNPKLPWSEELIEHFKNKWNWKLLGSNKYINWNWDLIQKFQDKIIWAHLSYDLYDELWISGLFQNPDLIWSIPYFKKYKKAIDQEFKEFKNSNQSQQFEYDHYWIYYHDTGNWSYELLEYILSGEDKDCNINDLDWENICRNGKKFWNKAFVEKYKNQFDYSGLLSNEYFSWNEYIYLLIPFLTKEHWLYLFKNEKLEWMPKLINTLTTHWTWEEFTTTPYLSLSSEKNLVKKHASFWNKQTEEIENQVNFYEFIHNKNITDHFKLYVNEKLLEDFLFNLSKESSPIYNTIVEKKLENQLLLEAITKPKPKERLVAKLKVVSSDSWNKPNKIACYVIQGTLNKNNKIVITRNDITIYNGTIHQLTKYGKPVDEIPANSDCGIIIKNYNDIRVGDLIEAYEK